MRGGAPPIEEETPSTDEDAPSADEEDPSKEEGTPSAEERGEVGSKDVDDVLSFVEFAESMIVEGACKGESLLVALVAFVSEISLSRFEESWKGTMSFKNSVSGCRSKLEVTKEFHTSSLNLPSE